MKKNLAIFLALTLCCSGSLKATEGHAAVESVKIAKDPMWQKIIFISAAAAIVVIGVIVYGKSKG